MRVIGLGVPPSAVLKFYAENRRVVPSGKQYCRHHVRKGSMHLKLKLSKYGEGEILSEDYRRHRRGCYDNIKLY
jgi:hypothetical protein